VEITQHIGALRDAASRLSTAAAEAGLDAAVPSCPDWVVRDVVRHQGGVHRWAAGIITTPRMEHWDVELEEVVGAWPDDADLLGWFDAGADALVTVLTDADPGVECWSFLPAPSPLAFWARRQAHETSIHGVDAELATGRPLSPFPAAFAADGVGELLEGFVSRRRQLTADPARTLRVSCSDTTASWLLSIGPDGVRTARGHGHAGGDADCEITGTAQDLYLTLWNRRQPGCLRTAGDREVLDLFLNRVRIRWS
jgi:uncharacterized protein (TIGR03083 family)